MITVPESLAFYWGEPTNRAAVNLLVRRSEVPPDLTLDEVERFEVAALAAQRVRLDYWRLLRNLWRQTWGEAVRLELPAARLLRYGEHVSFFETATPQSVEDSWTNAETSAVHTLGEAGHLVTAVAFEDAEEPAEIQLSFYYMDSEGPSAIGGDLELGADWGVDEVWRVTPRLPLATRGENARIDPAPLLVLARSAVAALQAAL